MISFSDEVNGSVIFEMNSTEVESMMNTWRSPAYTTKFFCVLGVHSSRTVPYRLQRCTPSLPVISFVDVNNIFTKLVYAQFRKNSYITIYYCSLP